jgi:lipopolysaccharide assembly outer membrane protein LptD (OstA)
MSRESNNLIHLNGDVQLNRAGQTIRADELIIDTQSEQLEANGGVIFEDINYRLKTETLRLNQKDGTAWFGPTEFKLRLSHASGTRRLKRSTNIVVDITGFYIPPVTLRTRTGT